MHIQKSCHKHDEPTTGLIRPYHLTHRRCRLDLPITNRTIDVPFPKATGPAMRLHSNPPSAFSVVLGVFLICLSQSASGQTASGDSPQRPSIGTQPNILFIFAGEICFVASRFHSLGPELICVLNLVHIQVFCTP